MRFAQQLHARDGALLHIPRSHVRDTVEYKNRRVELRHKFDYFRLHPAIAGKAQIDHFAIEGAPPPTLVMIYPGIFIPRAETTSVPAGSGRAWLDLVKNASPL
jgi:hypothetical protein